MEHEHQRRAAAEAFIASLNQLGASLELSDDEPIDLATAESPPAEDDAASREGSSQPDAAKGK